MNSDQYKKFDSISIENIALDLKKRSKIIDDAMNKILDNNMLKDKEIFNSNYLHSCKQFIYLKNYYASLCESIDLLASFLLRNVLPNYNDFSSLILDKFDFNFSNEVANILDISVKFDDDTEDVAGGDVNSTNTNSSSAVAVAPVYRQARVAVQNQTVSDNSRPLPSVDASIDQDDIEKMKSTVLSNSVVIPGKAAEETSKTNKKLNLAAIGALGTVAGIGVLGGTKLVKQSIKEEKEADNNIDINSNNSSNNIDVLSKENIVDKIDKGEVIVGKIEPTVNVSVKPAVPDNLPSLGAITTDTSLKDTKENTIQSNASTTNGVITA